MDRLPDNHMVVVCDRCFKASCWHGIWMCEEARSAGTVRKTVGELRVGDFGESEDYWRAG